MKIDWNQAYQESATPWRNRNFDLIRQWPEKTGVVSGVALDLGCGTGEISGWLADHGFKVEGLDFSEEALKTAKQLFPTASFFLWDLENLGKYDFRESSYDLIIDSKVLAHITNKEEYLDTIASKLGGVLILQLFLKHEEKPNLVINERRLDDLLKKHFAILRKDVYPQPGKIFAEYFLKRIP